MALFVKTVDIWSLTDEQVAALQPGQYVTAGPNGVKGRFYGKGASVVVAWATRIPAGKRRAEYLSKYVAYGRTVRNSAKKAA